MTLSSIRCRSSPVNFPPLSRGQLLRPADAGYEEARRVHNGLVDKRPALIARCRGVADVVDAVNLTRKLGLEVAVRGGGHNVAGRATIDGGVMIDLSPMKGIHVDPKGRTVRAQGGVTWGELNRETQLHGLAVTGGVVSSTGIAGLTLGGGLGWLMGKHGLALDNLRSVELVTAEGKVVRASEDEEPDLFWAVRGGGGNFGVATSFEYQLHPVGPIVTGGLIAHPFDAPATCCRFFRDSTASLPDEHTIFGGLTHAPDGSGTKLAAMVTCHCGSLAAGEEGDAAAEAIRVSGHGCARSDALLPTQRDARCRLSQGRVQLLEVELPRRIERRSHRHDDRLLRAMPDPDGPVAAGARPRRRDPDRGRRYGLPAPRRRLQFPRALAMEGCGRHRRCIAWARETYAEMQPFVAAGRYVNYLGDDETGDPVAAALRPQLSAPPGNQDQVRSEKLLPHEPEHSTVSLTMGRLPCRSRGADHLHVQHGVAGALHPEMAFFRAVPSIISVFRVKSEGIHPSRWSLFQTHGRTICLHRR